MVDEKNTIHVLFVVVFVGWSVKIIDVLVLILFCFVFWLAERHSCLSILPLIGGE
jgi:chromate transport protein ChrA